jgi:hypothetical protein
MMEQTTLTFKQLKSNLAVEGNTLCSTPPPFLPDTSPHLMHPRTSSHRKCAHVRYARASRWLPATVVANRNLRSTEVFSTSSLRIHFSRGGQLLEAALHPLQESLVRPCNDQQDNLRGQYLLCLSSCLAHRSFRLFLFGHLTRLNAVCSWHQVV